MKLSPTNQASRVALLLVVTLFTAFLYTFLHEGGHALVGVLSGGSITDFSLNFWQLSAHVGMNAHLTPSQMRVNNLAGALLPLLVWFVFLLAAPRRSNLVVALLKITTSLMVLSTLIAWMVLPVWEWIGNAPGDDVTQFIRNSGLHPLWVAGAALVIFCAGWVFFYRRFGGLGQVLENFRSAEPHFTFAEMRNSLLGLTGIFLLSALVAFGLNGFRFSSSQADPYRPPADYQLQQKVDLTEITNGARTLCDFTLSQPARVGIYLLVENVRADLLELRLSSAAGYDRLILHAEGYTADKDTPHVEENLAAGHYTCRLTSQSTRGILSLYTRGIPEKKE